MHIFIEENVTSIELNKEIHADHNNEAHANLPEKSDQIIHPSCQK